LIVAINFADFEYVWPRDPLVTELAALLSADDVGERAEQLFAQAFGPRALKVLAAMRSPEEVRALVADVLHAFHVLPTSAGRAPYFAERTGGQVGPPVDAWGLSAMLYEYVERLRILGYFEEAAPNSWRPSFLGTEQLDLILMQRLGVTHLWTGFDPNSWEDAWSEDLLFSVIEVLDELISRPRLTLRNGDDRRFHDFGRETGQALFRAWVNARLAPSLLSYRMAESGEDAGRIVVASTAEEDEYLDNQAASEHHGAGDEVGHAVALFRNREPTRETRRSAVAALARVLEARRALIIDEFLSKDESALFLIANTFDIRHNKADQHRDYDDAYLEWLFRWYLATIELTDRLIDRQGE
jgi:limonene-1,2-epoxide hydrolase